jgi:hypothetical protein
MISISLSNSLWEIPTNAVSWPATTKPWLVATMLMDAGPDSHLQTCQAHSGTEFAAHLLASGGLPVHMLCAVPYAEGWDIRDLLSVHIGSVGATAVVVVRGVDGVEFCPDSPGLAVSSVTSLARVAGLVARQRPSQPEPLASLAVTVHHLATKKLAEAAQVSSAPAPTAPAIA